MTAKSGRISWLRLIPRFFQQALERNQSLRTVIFNSGWLMLDKVVRMLLGIFVGAWVARYLGPEQYGELAYVVAFLALFQAIANFGADGIVVRDIAQHREAATGILGTVMAVRLLSGTFCWIAAIVVMACINGPTSPSVILTAVAGGALVFQAADTVDLWFQSQSQSRRTVTVKILAYLISNSAKVALIIGKAPLLAFAMTISLEAAISAFGLWAAYRKYSTSGYWKATWIKAIEILGESYPFMLSALAVVIYMRIDQLMIKELLGEQDLGVYAAALQLSTVWHVLPMTLVTSLAPFIARKRNAGGEAYTAALVNVFRLFGALGILAAAATALMSGVMVDILYGENYRKAAQVLSIHVCSNVFVFLGVAQVLWSINERTGRIALFNTLVGAGVSVALNMVLIPRFGLIGAAWTAVLSQFFSAVAANIIFARDVLRMQTVGLLFPKSVVLTKR